MKVRDFITRRLIEVGHLFNTPTNLDTPTLERRYHTYKTCAITALGLVLNMTVLAAVVFFQEFFTDPWPAKYIVGTNLLACGAAFIYVDVRVRQYRRRMINKHLEDQNLSPEAHPKRIIESLPLSDEQKARMVADTLDHLAAKS